MNFKANPHIRPREVGKFFEVPCFRSRIREMLDRWVSVVNAARQILITVARRLRELEGLRKFLC